MKTEEFRLTVVLETELLGSQTTREIATEFLAKKSGVEIPDDEMDTLPDVLERGTTVFHRDPAGNPVLWDYQIKGFIKEAGRLLSGEDGKPKALRSKVDQMVFLSPRLVPIWAPLGSWDEYETAARNGATGSNGYQRCGNLVDYLERPLRAQTAQGERVAIARSEMLPAGCWFRVGVTVIQAVREQDRIQEEVLRDLLDYGWYKGLLQWRNGGYGRFRYILERE